MGLSSEAKPWPVSELKEVLRKFSRNRVLECEQPRQPR